MPKSTEKKKVVIACRATQGCPGREAILVARHEIPGGIVVHYQCTTCKKGFTVQVGKSF